MSKESNRILISFAFAAGAVVVAAGKLSPILARSSAAMEADPSLICSFDKTEETLVIKERGSGEIKASLAAARDLRFNSVVGGPAVIHRTPLGVPLKEGVQFEANYDEEVCRTIPVDDSMRKSAKFTARMDELIREGIALKYPG